MSQYCRPSGTISAAMRAGAATATEASDSDIKPETANGVRECRLIMLAMTATLISPIAPMAQA